MDEFENREQRESSDVTFLPATNGKLTTTVFAKGVERPVKKKIRQGERLK